MWLHCKCTALVLHLRAIQKFTDDDVISHTKATHDISLWQAAGCGHHGDVQYDGWTPGMPSLTGTESINKNMQKAQNLERFVVTGQKRHNKQVDRSGRWCESPEASVSVSTCRLSRRWTPPDKQFSSLTPRGRLLESRCFLRWFLFLRVYNFEHYDEGSAVLRNHTVTTILPGCVHTERNCNIPPLTCVWDRKRTRETERERDQIFVFTLCSAPVIGPRKLILKKEVSQMEGWNKTKKIIFLCCL